MKSKPVPFRGRVENITKVAIEGTQRAFAMIERELTPTEHARVCEELSRFFAQRKFSDKESMS